MSETRHTLGGSTDLQRKDRKVDDAQVVRSVHLQMELAVRVQTYAGEPILSLTFNCGSTTPPLSRGSMEQVPEVSAYAIKSNEKCQPMNPTQTNMSRRLGEEDGKEHIRAIEFVYCLIHVISSSSVCTSAPGLCSRATQHPQRRKNGRKSSATV